MILIISY